MKKFNLKVFIICIVVVFGTAFFGTLFTSPNTGTDWYESIKPAITPPNWVFPIVWNILFLLIAISLYLSWTDAKNKDMKKKVALLFAVNLILNGLWSVLYFGLRNPLYAFIEIIFLWISILALVVGVYKINKKASYLLWPYLLWVSFAAVLNFLSL